MMKRNLSVAGAAILLLLAAACSSGGIGDILGGSNTNGSYATQVRGTVDSVDTNNQSILLTNVSANGSMLSSGGSGNTYRVYYDSRTTVSYNGQNYRPADLERGDQIDVNLARTNNNQPLATSMNVVYNARAGNTYPSGSSTYPSNPSTTYPSNGQYATVRGTVRYVDTTNNTIQLDSPSWISGFNRSTGSTPSTLYISFNPSMSINVNGQSYPISGLERGDVIDVQVSGSNTNNLYAQSLTLVRDVRQ